MKKSLCVLVTIVAMILCFATVTFAQDVLIEKQIKNISFKNDKNGKAFAKVIISGTATLNGVTYSKDIFASAFDSDVVTTLKSYKKGQTLKAIVSEGQYNGNASYTILKVI
jgi:hypothetical protein